MWFKENGFKYNEKRVWKTLQKGDFFYNACFTFTAKILKKAVVIITINLSSQIIIQHTLKFTTNFWKKAEVIINDNLDINWCMTNTIVCGDPIQ